VKNNKQIPVNEIICGDCEVVLKNLPQGKINLIVTSPPYADSRKKTYGGIHPDKYVEWMLPKTKLFYDILNSRGTFILNIKEKVVKGERHTYVFDLIKEMKKQGWLWTEEFIWCKKNSYPGKWSNRFRDSWERCLQFNKEKKFDMYQNAVMIPVGDWSKKRLSKLSNTDMIRDESKSKSGFGKNISNWLGRNMVYPTNVLHLATECSNKNHSAAFPESLPEWFIQLFTKKGDTVLDPFLGSGTSAVVAKKLDRKYIGIDIVKEYCDKADDKIRDLFNNKKAV